MFGGNVYHSVVGYGKIFACCLIFGVLKAVNILRDAGVVCPPADHVGLKGNDVNFFRLPL